MMVRFDPQAGILGNSSEAERNRRNRGRLKQESLACSLGEVADLSASGMRIFCSRRPSGSLDVELFGQEIRLRLRAEVVWTKRRGLFKHEAGLRFIGVDPAMAQQLSRLSLNNRMRRVMPNDRAA